MNDNNFYVYCFYNEDWDEIFYIGKGVKHRYKDYNNRNHHIKAILENHKCTSKILIDGLDEKTAIQAECELKQKYKDMGCPIIDYEGKTAHQRIGIERAKQEGKYTGRKTKEIPNFSEWYIRLMRGEITKKDAANELNISCPTLYRRIKTYEEEQGITNAKE